MKKQIKWKERKSVSCWEGTIKGDTEPLIFIEGGLCVTDLRESKAAIFPDFKEPKHYRTVGMTLDERKQLAEDLVSGENFEKHEANRLAVIAESERFVKLMAEAKAFLKSLDEI